MVTPTSPPSLHVLVSGGDLKPPGGEKAIPVSACELTFDAPELRDFESQNPQGHALAVPSDYQPDWAVWNSWPGKDLVHLSPRYQDGTLILGGLFRTFREDSLQVTSIDGKTTYRKDVDFVYDADWGTVANKEGRLKEPIVARAKGALQRLDLIQVSTADGKVSVKKGKSVMVSPDLPEPDPGCAALAGIYLAPWQAARNPHYDAAPGPMRGAADYAISEHEIAAIHPVAPTAPIHPERIARTLAKLRGSHDGNAQTDSPSGKTNPHPDEVRIAFMGDSITLGAESSMWFLPAIAYGPKDRTYRGTLIRKLRERFSKTVIKPIEAYKGGAGIELATAEVDKMLSESRPDLVIIAFGANDISGPAGGQPHTSLETFRQQLEILTDKVHGAGGDVLLVTGFPLNLWLRSGMTQRQPTYNAALMEAADAKGAAVADVYTEYGNLGSRGIPPWSTLHNWINHPSDVGHAVYADQLLSFFPAR